MFCFVNLISCKYVILVTFETSKGKKYLKYLKRAEGGSQLILVLLQPSYKMPLSFRLNTLTTKVKSLALLQITPRMKMTSLTCQ